MAMKRTILEMRSDALLGDRVRSPDFIRDTIERFEELRPLRGLPVDLISEKRCDLRQFALNAFVGDLYPGSATPGAMVWFYIDMDDPVLMEDRSAIGKYLELRLRMALIDLLLQPWPADYFGPYDPSGKPPKNDVY